MCAEVLKLIIEMITDIVSKTICQSAPLHSTMAMRTPTTSQVCVCGTEAVGQTLFSELLRESLKGSLCKAFCDVVGANTFLSITPKFKVIADEVNSVLSETIQASLHGGSSSSARATSNTYSVCSSKLNSTTLEIVD